MVAKHFHQLGAKASPKDLVKVLAHQIQHTLCYYAFAALASEVQYSIDHDSEM